MKLLWIKTSPLHPLNRGGDLRSYHLLRKLMTRNHVTFLGLVADEGQRAATEKAGEYSHEAYWVDEPKASLRLPRPQFLAGALLNLASPYPYAVSRFKSSALCQKVAELLEGDTFDVVICDFLFPAASLPWPNKRRSKVPWLLFQHNVESLIWRRRAAGKLGLSAPYWHLQKMRMERFEHDMCRRFDGVITVSDEDSRVLKEEFGLSNVLGSTPTGVAVDFFQSVPRTVSVVPCVVFVGSMDWYANEDAVMFFVRDIWPLVRSRIPNALFQIVGRQPSPAVQALAEPGAGIEVTGTVPDVRPYMRGAHLMVVPLRIGGGTRLKVFEAMAAELPVVSTRVGAEGLTVENGRHALLADTAEEIAEAVIRVLEMPKLAESLRSHALDEIAKPNSWDAAAAIFESFCAPEKRPRSVAL